MEANVEAVAPKGILTERGGPGGPAWRLRPGPPRLHLHAPLRRQQVRVVRVTQSLAKELAKDGITVNAFCPRIISTDMWAYNDSAWGKLLGDYQPGELMAEWVAGIPLGRVRTGEDVAGLVAFLASSDPAYITGQTINVDGGMFMS